MPHLECMAECAGSFLALVNDSVSEREHVQTILNQMHENLEEGILTYGKCCYLSTINILIKSLHNLMFMCFKYFIGESISIDTIKHAFLAFEKFECLKITMVDNIKTLSMINDEDHDFYAGMQNMSDYIELLVKQIN